MSLEKMKMLRTRRMEQRFIELQEQRRILAEWQTRLQEKKRKLREFQSWRLEHQEHLFHDLQNQPFAPQALFDYQTKLEQFRLQEEHIKGEVVNTQQEMQTAANQVQAAEQSSAEANLKLEKIKEIIKQQGQEKPREEPAQ